ncbi:LysR family transcriptional regulator [Aeromicrobium camelliae]|uniref:LysR family transcriptional regulator n=1 Tax=Aeromicrobium camelliae TaxID=1538144 RepID=A0A3N6ZM59_9ACTN|nr:LysR family transcriptional regulator [Aeromicrobium camelliae]RQN08127.1 LysR family transcriptional regulator [Aeromicrobium camelliae]
MAQYTLRQLEYFVAVAEAGSVTAAAQEIHLSQSALSTALVELERTLGVQLLLRHHARGVTLSAAGEELLAAARNLLRQADELADQARGLGHDLTGTLHLACFGVLAPYVLPEILAEAAAHFPGLEINTSEVDLAELTEGVARGRFELAIGYDLAPDARLSMTPLRRLAPYILLPHNHRLAKRRRVKLHELSHEPLALLDLPHSREYFAGIFESAGVNPLVRYRSTSAATCRAIVARGLAYTLLNVRPRHDSEGNDQAVVAVDIADQAPSLGVVVMKAEGARATRRMAAVQGLIEDVVQRGGIGAGQ